MNIFLFFLWRKVKISLGFSVGTIDRKSISPPPRIPEVNVENSRRGCRHLLNSTSYVLIVLLGFSRKGGIADGKFAAISDKRRGEEGKNGEENTVRSEAYVD